MASVISQQIRSNVEERLISLLRQRSTKSQNSEKNGKILEEHIHKHIRSSREEEREARYRTTVIEVCDALRKKTALTEIVEGLRSKIPYIWKTPVMAQHAKLQKEEDDILENPYEVEEGVHQCDGCGSKKTMSWEMQTSSSDEGKSHFVKCFNCERRWKMR
jgi:DNA-directed RNA polymerase subunit M/transcription elongation factor TFIIS